jgi:hypothetical protein
MAATRKDIAITRVTMVLPVVLLVLLNGVDIALTRVALRSGAAFEANPLARALMGGGRVELLKLGLLCALALRTLRRRPTLRFAIACWVATGAYAMVVVSNVYVVWSLR